MRRRAITLIEVAVVLAIVGVLWVILSPVLSRPLLWSQTPTPPLRFQKAPLQSVFARLHQELYRQRHMGFIKDTVWETPALKTRTVTLQTASGQTLGQVLRLIEKGAGVAVQSGGSCGTCGWPMGKLHVYDAKPKK